MTITLVSIELNEKCFGRIKMIFAYTKGESIYDMDPELSSEGNEEEAPKKEVEKKLHKEVSIYELNAANDEKADNDEPKSNTSELSFTYLASERKVFF